MLILVQLASDIRHTFVMDLLDYTGYKGSQLSSHAQQRCVSHFQQRVMNKVRQGNEGKICTPEHTVRKVRLLFDVACQN